MANVEVGDTPNITQEEAAAMRAATSTVTKAEAAAASNSPRDFGRLVPARLPIGPMGYGNRDNGAAVIVWDDNSWSDDPAAANAVNATAFRNLFISKGVPCCLALNPATLVANTTTGLAFYLGCQNTYGFEALNHGRNHDSIINANDATQEAVVNGGLDDLLALGFNVKHFCYTFGEHNARLRKVVAQRHGSACAVFQGRAINTPPIDTFSMGRIGIGVARSYPQTLTDNAQIYAARAKATNSLVIYMLHPHEDVAGADLATVSALLDYLAAQNIPVLTMSQAMARFGNQVDVGDAAIFEHTKVAGTTQLISVPGFSVSADGQLWAPRQRRIRIGASPRNMDQDQDYQHLGGAFAASTSGGSIGRVGWAGSGVAATTITPLTPANSDGVRGSGMVLYLNNSASASNRINLNLPSYYLNNNNAAGNIELPVNLWSRWRFLPQGALNGTNRNIFVGIGTGGSAAIAPTVGARYGIVIDDSRNPQNIYYYVRNTATVTGSVSGTTMTVTGVTSGAINIGQTVTGTGIAANSVVVSQTSGAPGGIGIYELTESSAATGAITITGLLDSFTDSGIVATPAVNDTPLAQRVWTFDMAVDAGVGELRIWANNDLVHTRTVWFSGITLTRLLGTVIFGQTSATSLEDQLAIRDVEWGFCTDPF